MNDDIDHRNILELGKQLRESSRQPLVDLTDTRDIARIVEAHSRLDTLKRRRNVERGILQFIHEASRRTWSVKEYKSRLVACFYGLVREHFGVYDRPTDCSPCNELCVADLCYIMLSEELSIYACVQHAVVHECGGGSGRGRNDADVQLASECPCTTTSADTNIICVFSGKVVSHHLMQTGGSGKDFSSDDAHTRSHASLNFRLGRMELESMQDQFHNADAKLRRQTAIVKAIEAASAAPRAASSATPPLSRCTSTTAPAAAAVADLPPVLIDKRAAQKRRVESIEQQDKRARLSENSYFEYRKDQIIEEAGRILASVCEDVICDILFDGEARRQINEASLFKVSSEMRASLSAYHSAQKRAFQMPVYTHCLAAFFTPQSKLSLMRIVEYDRAQVAVFCERATRLWKLCFSAPAVVAGLVAPCTFKTFSLALLYLMKQGLTIPARGSVWTEGDSGDRITVVARDETLCVDLPEETQLRSFGKRGRELMRKILGKGGTGPTPRTTNTTAAPQQHRTTQKPSRLVQQIEVDGIGHVRCSTFLPKHLLAENIGEAGEYSASELSLGIEFIRNAVVSFDEANRRKLAFV